MGGQHGYEVRTRGSIGLAQLRYFEPWDVQSIDGRTSILMPYASDEALHGLLLRLDDFALELLDVRPLDASEARSLCAAGPRPGGGAEDEVKDLLDMTLAEGYSALAQELHARSSWLRKLTRRAAQRPTDELVDEEGREYRIDTNLSWVDRPGGDIRVEVTLCPAASSEASITAEAVAPRT
jgi:hypothetical protein